MLSSGSLAQTVDIETPELVVVTCTIAGVGSRIADGIVPTRAPEHQGEDGPGLTFPL
jgi:hypothetical protein